MNYWIEIKFYLMVIAACHVIGVFILGLMCDQSRERNQLLRKKKGEK